MLERDRHVCRYCGHKPATIADHYTPLALQGQDTEENLVAACGECNSVKADRDPTEFLQSKWLAERRLAVGQHARTR